MKKTYIIAACIVLAAVLIAVWFSGQRPSDPTEDTPDANVTSKPVVTKPKTTSYGVTVVSLGQKITFADFSLTLTKVESDSRCPANANCVWGGTTTVTAEYVDATGTTTKVIELRKTTTFGSFTVTLDEVFPETTMGSKIPSSEYRFSLNVQKRNTATTSGGCFVGGCSAQICSSEKDIASTCEYKEEYMCYKTAKCERQSNGSCGWTQTTSLAMCLKDAATVNLQ